MKHIFLIGFMGCGKSAVSAYMSQNYNMDIIEMDEEIVRRENMTIPHIFENKGESYFRNLETKLLQELEGESFKIVSCGGGVVLREENVEVMKKNGFIVLLTAEPQTILERVKEDDNRPLLRGNKNVGYIKELLEKRMPNYTKAADIIVQTDNKSIKEICEEILDYRR